MTPEETSKRLIETANIVSKFVRRVHENQHTKNRLPGFLAKLSSPFWPGAMAAALQTDQDIRGQAYRLVDSSIVEALRPGTRLDVVADIYNRMPREGVALQDTALEVARQIVVAVEQRNLIEKDPAYYLTLLNNYVGRLLQLGEANIGKEARKAFDFASDPNRFALPGFASARATTLENWSHYLRQTNRTSEALAAMDKARELYDQLLEEGASEYKRNLAICLTSYIALLMPLQRYDDAVRFGRQAAALFRELKSENEQAGEFAAKGLQAWIDNVGPNLATCLIALSSALSKTGEFQEALSAASEARHLLAKLVEESQEFTPLFGQAQNNEAMALDDLGRFEEALMVVSEAVDIFRNLERLRPETYTQYVAHTLRRKSLELAKLARYEEALETCEESAHLYRKVWAKHTQYRAECSGTLQQLEVILRGLGKTEEAEKIAVELAELTNERREG